MASYSLDPEERALLDAPKPGFWICASVAGPCDMTFETAIETARFYPIAPSDEIIAALLQARAQTIGAKMFAGAPEAARAALEAMPGSALAGTLARRAQEEPPESFAGLGIHPAAPGSAAWGALELTIDETMFLLGSPDDEHRSRSASRFSLSPEGLEEFKAAASAFCSARLDGFERAMNLPPASFESLQGAAPGEEPPRWNSRPRWEEDDPPACLGPALEPAVASALERADLDSRLRRPGPPSRAPRV